ncbi:Kinesin-like protein KIF14 [Toxocara canis]|uniref:Kinesin-like protein KIF14 n=1 Tax=Toxocara canis TaxID=6265 RepID=A0A0B2V8Q9_TOXCA|nr:Kinesin-like protein KIF14 [Toxocara canis]
MSTPTSCRVETDNNSGRRGRTSGRFTGRSRSEQRKPAVPKIERLRQSTSTSRGPDTAKCNIQVALRVRPFNEHESKQEALLIEDNKVHIVTANKKCSFEFAHIFGPESSQEDVYKKFALPLLAHAMAGINVCIFAYGQTGSGKTYSIVGNHDNPGLLQRFGKDFFDAVSEVKPEERHLSISFYEIYQEKAYDLLSDAQEALRVRGGEETYVAGLIEADMSSFSDFEKLRRRAWVKRATASTALSRQSSRSHAIVRLVYQRMVTEKAGEQTRPFAVTSHIYFVDLAGSERLESSGYSRLEETIAINVSLSALHRVIFSAAEGMFFVVLLDKNDESNILVRHSFSSVRLEFVESNFERVRRELAADKKADVEREKIQVINEIDEELKMRQEELYEGEREIRTKQGAHQEKQMARLSQLYTELQNLQALRESFVTNADRIFEEASFEASSSPEKDRLMGLKSEVDRANFILHRFQKENIYNFKLKIVELNGASKPCVRFTDRRIKMYGDLSPTEFAALAEKLVELNVACTVVTEEEKRQMGELLFRRCREIPILVKMGGGRPSTIMQTAIVNSTNEAARKRRTTVAELRKTLASRRSTFSSRLFGEMYGDLSPTEFAALAEKLVELNVACTVVTEEEKRQMGELLFRRCREIPILVKMGGGRPSTIMQTAIVNSTNEAARKRRTTVAELRKTLASRRSTFSSRLFGGLNEKDEDEHAYERRQFVRSVQCMCADRKEKRELRKGGCISMLLDILSDIHNNMLTLRSIDKGVVNGMPFLTGICTLAQLDAQLDVIMDILSSSATLLPDAGSSTTEVVIELEHLLTAFDSWLSNFDDNTEVRTLVLDNIEGMIPRIITSLGKAAFWMDERLGEKQLPRKENEAYMIGLRAAVDEVCEESDDIYRRFSVMRSIVSQIITKTSEALKEACTSYKETPNEGLLFGVIRPLFLVLRSPGRSNADVVLQQLTDILNRSSNSSFPRLEGLTAILQKAVQKCSGGSTSSPFRSRPPLARPRLPNSPRDAVTSGMKAV